SRIHESQSSSPAAAVHRRSVALARAPNATPAATRQSPAACHSPERTDSSPKNSPTTPVTLEPTVASPTTQLVRRAVRSISGGGVPVMVPSDAMRKRTRFARRLQIDAASNAPSTARPVGLRDHRIAPGRRRSVANAIALAAECKRRDGVAVRPQQIDAVADHRPARRSRKCSRRPKGDVRLDAPAAVSRRYGVEANDGRKTVEVVARPERICPAADPQAIAHRLRSIVAGWRAGERSEKQHGEYDHPFIMTSGQPLSMPFIDP